ncbi:MAG: sugar ABC transporter permease [Chloroflexi bacterium]|nr:sugar ABC transporter permease [Chloroflexota bacterium]
MGLDAVTTKAKRITRGRESRQKTLRKMWFYRYHYLLLAPGLLFFVIFHYVPMWGVIIAFQDFRLWEGILGSPWVGLEHFRFFVNGPYFTRLIRNTLVISFLDLIVVFPTPIILALLLNEVAHRAYKRVIQTISYLPYFVSWVVVGGLLIYIFSINVGMVTRWLARLGLAPVSILGSRSAFLPLVVGTSIWKGVGWGAIIYLAAIAGINPELYEVAMIDGAGRFQRMLYITIPSIMSVAVIMLILRIGAILNVNFLQILILLGNDASLLEVGDVIQTWVYRAGFRQQNMSLATAVGLMNGVVGLILVYVANKIANRLTEGGLWS